ncbi:hypothetical protein E4U52_006341 [Claviceps spartinae]|nr:hypothetical protein E4U52_006341 [Claviceps spartinae]
MKTPTLLRKMGRATGLDDTAAVQSDVMRESVFLRLLLFGKGTTSFALSSETDFLFSLWPVSFIVKILKYFRFMQKIFGKTLDSPRGVDLRESIFDRLNSLGNPNFVGDGFDLVDASPKILVMINRIQGLPWPWMNVDFILEAQQAWADKYARGRPYRHHEQEGLLVQRLYQKNIRARNRYMQHALEHELRLWKFEARACFEADYERALHFPPILFGALTGSLGGSADIHPHVRIPVNLITGPWDEQKKRLLFWLVRAGARVRDDDKEDFWKVRIACLDAAVISPKKVDPLIVNCLMGPWIYTALPKDAADERLAKLSKRIDKRQDKRDMRDVLRFLIKGMDKDRQYLFHDFSDDDLDEDEEVLDNDAMDAIFAAQYFDEMDDEQGDGFYD